MRIFNIIVALLLLLGCNFSKTSIESNSFDSKASELFFNADVKIKYDDLVGYFKTVGTLKEIESGWTLYPPLSALHQENDNIYKKSFEFHSYLNISSELRSGTLGIKKFSPTKESLAVLEINLEFNLLKDAQKFYKTAIEKFNIFPQEKEESALENIHSTTIHDNGSDTVLKISLFED